jgi:hypothetical protein
VWAATYDRDPEPRFRDGVVYGGRGEEKRMKGGERWNSREEERGVERGMGRDEENESRSVGSKDDQNGSDVGGRVCVLLEADIDWFSFEGIIAGNGRDENRHEGSSKNHRTSNLNNGVLYKNSVTDDSNNNNKYVSNKYNDINDTDCTNNNNSNNNNNNDNNNNVRRITDDCHQILCSVHQNVVVEDLALHHYLLLLAGKRGSVQFLLSAESKRDKTEIMLINGKGSISGRAIPYTRNLIVTDNDGNCRKRVGEEGKGGGDGDGARKGLGGGERGGDCVWVGSWCEGSVWVCLLFLLMRDEVSH